MNTYQITDRIAELKKELKSDKYRLTGIGFEYYGFEQDDNDKMDKFSAIGAEIKALETRLNDILNWEALPYRIADLEKQAAALLEQDRTCTLKFGRDRYARSARNLQQMADELKARYAAGV